MKDDYYVYMYIDPISGRPFYIGKGCKNRYRDISQKQRNPWLYNKLQKIRNTGLLVDDFTIFYENNMSESDALILERELVEFYGRKDIGTGILLNMSDGGDGMIGNIKRRKPTLYDHKDEIFKLYEDGCTIKDISKKYNCGRSVVNNLFKFYGVNRRPSGVKKPDIDWEKVKSLYENGDSIRHISMEFKCDHGTIKKFLESSGYNISDGRKTSNIRGGKNIYKLNDVKDEIVCMYNNGKTIHHISKLYHVDSSTVKGLLSREGVI